MIHRNLNAFLTAESHHGVYVFTSDACDLCAQFERDLAQYDTSSFTAIEVTGDEDLILSTMFNVQGFPFTIVYVNNEIGLVKKGVLFQKQMNELFAFMKANDIKQESPVRAPVAQMTPVILEMPSNNETSSHTDYVKQAFSDSISKGEAPLNFDSIYEGVLDRTNPAHNLILKKMKEAWSLVAKKTILYVDEGVTVEMLDGITDAAARGREIEIRKIHD